jgi:HD domain/MASE9
MENPTAVRRYVGLVALVALVALMASWNPALPKPGIWEFFCFIAVALMLDQRRNDLKVSALGSTSFVIHIAAGILFGGFWGGLVAGVATAIGMLASGTQIIKLVFNSAQRSLSVTAAYLVYRTVGGGMPPAYLQLGGHLETGALQLDLVLFFAFAATYVLVNSTAVSGVVALSTARPFRDVWHLNTRGVIGYDLAASAIALLIAALYVKSSQLFGFGSFGLIGVIVPIAVVRHIYTLYYQLQESGEELLEVMVKAIEARDPYTSGHSRRVKELSRTIALELGLSAREVELIETAALLHDVGKIHEEFAPLLRKEGRLDEAETALMQTHAARSAELVGIISKFKGFIQESVRHHHERWDGKGYPQGLAGNRIPIGARVILVSDTIDAMTSDRPYRKRLTLDQVVAELLRCKGSQFDPQIVEIAVSSVAVRHLIAEPPAEKPRLQPPPSLTKRPSWGVPRSLWKVRGA